MLKRVILCLMMILVLAACQQTRMATGKDVEPAETEITETQGIETAEEPVEAEIEESEASEETLESAEAEPEESAEAEESAETYLEITEAKSTSGVSVLDAMGGVYAEDKNTVTLENGMILRLGNTGAYVDTEERLMSDWDGTGLFTLRWPSVSATGDLARVMTISAETFTAWSGVDASEWASFDNFGAMICQLGRKDDDIYIVSFPTDAQFSEEDGEHVPYTEALKDTWMVLEQFCRDNNITINPLWADSQLEYEKGSGMLYFLRHVTVDGQTAYFTLPEYDYDYYAYNSETDRYDNHDPCEWVLTLQAVTTEGETVALPLDPAALEAGKTYTFDLSAYETAALTVTMTAFGTEYTLTLKEEGSVRTLTLFPDSAALYVDGEAAEDLAAPVVAPFNNKAFLPLEAVTEAFGGTYQQDGEAAAITWRWADGTLHSAVFTVDAFAPIIDGEESALHSSEYEGTVAVIWDGVFYIPVEQQPFGVLTYDWPDKQYYSISTVLQDNAVGPWAAGSDFAELNTKVRDSLTELHGSEAEAAYGEALEDFEHFYTSADVDVLTIEASGQESIVMVWLKTDAYSTARGLRVGDLEEKWHYLYAGVEDGIGMGSETIFIEVTIENSIIKNICLFIPV